MPSYGEYQKPAGMKLACGCNRHCACKIPRSKTMIKTSKTFTIEGPEYKGNAVLNANR